MKTARVEQIGIVIPKWIIRGTKDGVLVYQYTFDTKEEADEAAADFLNR
jgi:hypothetical protein